MQEERAYARGRWLQAPSRKFSQIELQLLLCARCQSVGGMLSQQDSARTCRRNPPLKPPRAGTRCRGHAVRLGNCSGSGQPSSSCNDVISSPISVSTSKQPLHDDEHESVLRPGPTSPSWPSRSRCGVCRSAVNTHQPNELAEPVEMPRLRCKHTSGLPGKPG